jgi:hypothetical protein
MKIPLIKFFIFNESENKNDEALFFFLVGLADFIFAIEKMKNVDNMFLVFFIICIIMIF